MEQISKLKEFYGRNLENYSGLFLGNHDALGADVELICNSAKLDHLPYHTFINIGLESCDTPTLAQIGKPLDNTEVLEAFDKMVEINAIYENIEVTGNFVIGKGLSDDHNQSLKELLRKGIKFYQHING
jgi:hypothetical protein